MATRMTSARFVGRSEQLAELEAALRDAAEGRPSLALVGGESGVGKSRLADELIGHAREAGARVLTGDCVELGEDELPYAPLLTALRPLVRDGDPALDALAPSLRAALDAILPGLGEDRSTGEATQSRVFEALLTVLDGLAEDGPAVLVIEDLHWADSSTRSFISFLARSVCDERLLVVGTYRSDELHRRHPLRPLLAELASDPYTRLIDLPRFSPAELAEQLEGIVGDRPEPELVQRVYSRSEGNALYAEEILAAGLDGRGSLPPTLRDALMLRVERLSPRTQELIRWLACQPAADHVLVAAVAGLDPADLRDALREAVASHIVVTVSDESYGFRHALLREVVYEDLLPGERTEMHAALAGALEERIEAGERGAHITAQVAHHWGAAGDQPRTLAAAARAGLAAERVNAFAEAQALFERVLSLWERVPDPEALAGIDEFELLRHAAVAADQAGDPARQEALLRRALQLVDAEADPDRAALIQRAAQPVAVEPAPAGRLGRDAARGARAPAGGAERRAREAPGPVLEAADGPVALRRGGRVCARGAQRGACGRLPRGRGHRPQRPRHGARRERGGRCGCGVPARVARDRSRGGARDGGGRRLDQHLGRAQPRRPHRRGARGGSRGARDGVHAGLADHRLAAALESPSTASTSATGTAREEAIPPASRRHTGGTLLYWQTCRGAARARPRRRRGRGGGGGDAREGHGRAEGAAVRGDARHPERGAVAPPRRHRRRTRGDRRRARPDRVLLRGRGAGGRAGGDGPARGG